MRSAPMTLSVLLAVCAAGLHADPAATARTAIQNNYVAIDTATSHKDISGIDAFYTPDYVAVTKDGKHITAAQERQEAQQLFAITRSMETKTTITAFTLNSPTRATVTAHSHGTAVLSPPQSQQPVNMTLDATSRDIWVKTAKGWREKGSQLLASAMSVNGKPVPGQ